VGGCLHRNRLKEAGLEQRDASPCCEVSCALSHRRSPPWQTEPQHYSRSFAGHLRQNPRTHERRRKLTRGKRTHSIDGALRPSLVIKVGASVAQRTGRKRQSKPAATQLEFVFPLRAASSSGVQSLTSTRKRSRDVKFWQGFLGRRAPAPQKGELPLNTKRAAHYLRRSSRWMEAVRHEENSPPWRKIGGIFEYYESQLDWWKEQIADL